MDNYAAAEQSYNNGYRAGFYAGKIGAEIDPVLGVVFEGHLASSAQNVALQ